MMDTAPVFTPSKASSEVVEVWGEEAFEIVKDAAEIEIRMAEVNWRTHLLGHPVPLRTGLGTWEQMRLDQARMIRAALKLTAP
jgi:hypothetical protein